MTDRALIVDMWCMLTPVSDEIMPAPITEGRHADLTTRVYGSGYHSWWMKIRYREGVYMGRHRPTNDPFSRARPRMVHYPETGWNLICF